MNQKLRNFEGEKKIAIEYAKEEVKVQQEHLFQ
jgi:hypothetical protein